MKTIQILMLIAIVVLFLCYIYGDVLYTVHIRKTFVYSCITGVYNWCKNLITPDALEFSEDGSEDFAKTTVEKINRDDKNKSKDGERLTAWEKSFIWKQLKKDGTITCPNCRKGKMVEGPQGGMSVNIRCRTCGQGINFLILPGKDDHALDWCDNIGIDESWIYVKKNEKKD